ncbi:MAG: hypothetical protein GC178_09680 [Flavobacteriales bacterium]|nr:hypothetical protein [Flavobacteriales bacterium]
MKKLALTVLGFTLALQSCKKDPTVNEMLTDADWHMTALTIDPAIIVNNVAITDYYSQLYDYDKDNILRFRTDGTYISDEGALKEHPSDPQTKQGNWLLSASEDMITVWVEEDTITYDLLKISEDLMRLSYAQRDTATQINYTLTADFAH